MAGDKTTPANHLITTKAPDASLNVQLHPLVLLTISDYITRHASRQQKWPIVGAIVGQQNGRNFTLEHAYECKTAAERDDVAVDGEWFEERLEQYREVHKAPPLDLVAMFMLGSVEGPTAGHAQLVQQVQALTSSDSLMLLLFHPELVDQLQGGKLPITIYESVREQHGGEIKFRELGFEVETGEAEMIGVDFVATGGGNATAVPKAETAGTSTAGESSSSKEKKTKGKGKAKDDDTEANGAASSTNILSPEDEELLASLTAKANAIKMLNQRLALIRAYLSAQPASYLTDATSASPPPRETTNYPLLRNISSLLSRLPLLVPPPPTTTTTTTATPPPSHQPPASTTTSNTTTAASTKEKSDVHLTALLASLTRSISDAQTLGAKFNILQREKQAKERKPFGGRGMGFGDEGGLLAGDGNGGGGSVF